MKKFLSLLPVAALLFSASCSSDDEPTVQIPDGPITLQAPVADEPVMNYPTQIDPATANAQIVSGSYLTAFYDNGQEITYYCAAFSSTSGETIRVAFVANIRGNAKDVTIPLKVKNYVSTAETEEEKYREFDVRGFRMYEGGVGDGIESIYIPAQACQSYSATEGLTDLDPAQFYDYICQGNDLQNVFLEKNFMGFCSINGAVYDSEKTTFISCPRGREGQFVVATGVETIGNHSFNFAKKVTSVTLPESVTAVGDKYLEAEDTDILETAHFVFNQNDRLVLINSLATVPPICIPQAFGGYARKALLRVPTASVEAYKAQMQPDAYIPEEGEDADPLDYNGWAVITNIEGYNFTLN